MKADINLDMKTHERTEGTVADDEKYGDISSARVDDDIMRFISFGDQKLTEPSVAFTVSNHGALVDDGAEAPKPRRLPVKMRMLTPTSGLLHTGSASTPRRNIFQPQPLPRGFREPRRGKGTTNPRTNFNQLAPPSCHRKVIKTKLRQNLVFDSDDIQVGCTAAHFWEAARCFVEGFVWDAVIVSGAGACLVERRTALSYFKKSKQFGTPYFIAVGQYFS